MLPPLHVILLCSCQRCWCVFAAYLTVITFSFSIIKDFLHRTWLQGDSGHPWRHLWPFCKKAGSELQSAQVDDRCTLHKHVITWMHMLSVCLSLSSPFSLLHLYIRCNWIFALGGQSVIRTSKSWMSVRAALMPCWGRIKGTIDKCDMLIWGQIEEKIPLSGHEGTPHGSCFRGGCHFNSRTSIVDLASKRKEMMVMRCFCFWALFMTVRPWRCLNRGNFFCWKLLSWGSCLCWRRGVLDLCDWHCVILQNPPFAVPPQKIRLCG